MATFINLTNIRNEHVVIAVDAIAMLRPPFIYEAEGHTAVVFMNGQLEIVRETVLGIEELIRNAQSPH